MRSNNVERAASERKIKCNFLMRDVCFQKLTPVRDGKNIAYRLFALGPMGLWGGVMSVDQRWLGFLPVASCYGCSVPMVPFTISAGSGGRRPRHEGWAGTNPRGRYGF